jgi:hypothetical protein
MRRGWPAIDTLEVAENSGNARREEQRHSNKNCRGHKDHPKIQAMDRGKAEMDEATVRDRIVGGPRKTGGIQYSMAKSRAGLSSLSKATRVEEEEPQENNKAQLGKRRMMSANVAMTKRKAGEWASK